MTSTDTLFFGSTSDSVIVLDALYHGRIPSYRIRLIGVTTQPPSPVGRKHTVTPTPVESWARAHEIPVYSFPPAREKPWQYSDENSVAASLGSLGAQLLVCASYGQKIPISVIGNARFGGLNVHPSLLPRWRGADPVPWAILSGDRQTGVSVVTLSAKFDEGRIIAQKKVPIKNTDRSDPLRTKLFRLGSALLVRSLPGFLDGRQRGKKQSVLVGAYARRLTRQDGYEPWDTLQRTTGENALRIERKIRALAPWPGVWTVVSFASGPKRLKILDASLSNDALRINTVQMEGKNPIPFAQFQNAYQLGTT